MSYDIAVIGAGTAGLPLAIEAARQGLDVVLVEQSDLMGGTLWRSWAQLSAGGTSLQAKKGIHDNPQLHFDDVMRISKRTADPMLVRLAVEEAPATIEWLMESGFDMDPEAPAILHFHEPYSVPRTYWGRNAGRSVLDVLLPQLDEQVARGRIDVRLSTTMTELATVGSDEVGGVVVRGPDGGTEEIEADAVVLTTGGYAGNHELFPKLTQGAPLVGPGAPTSTGAGILAAVRIGARVRGEDLFLPTYGGVLKAGSRHETVHLDDYPQLTPRHRQPWEIHVNVRGERFVAEDTDSVDVRENALLAQPDLVFWVVYDAQAAVQAPPLFPSWSSDELGRAFAENSSFVTADDLVELARAAGIEPSGLVATVEDYNRAVAQGEDRLGRRHLPAPISTPPFFAVRNHGTTLKSPAGLAVDADLRVLSASGPFARLYAVGEALGGSTMSGKSFVSGMSVTPALSLGRRLARTLAGVQGAEHPLTTGER
ncbi:FAD-dependent oxidoreductase [uncultured Aeromicrobium sp.]|uniref:FAD-dependent oxidoreductase n=1 Tax=uncultured Aeromicrobium sp. TaxID=337820 RepID=UPI0025CDA57A|nr:FAD-dependent oxidoreductase [uncultured Aeromicrobium sp.]